MEEIDFESDDFADIVAKDKRFDARAYALLMDVVHFTSGDDGKHCSGQDVWMSSRNGRSTSTARSRTPSSPSGGWPAPRTSAR